MKLPDKLYSMILQINMICKQCDEILPVTVKGEEQIEAETAEETDKDGEPPAIFEQVPCPKCGEDNIWDRLKRNFIRT